MGHHVLEAPCSASLMGCFVAFHYNISVPIGTTLPIDFIQSTFGELSCSNKNSVASLTHTSRTGRLCLCPRYLPFGIQADRLFVTWPFTSIKRSRNRDTENKSFLIFFLIWLLPNLSGCIILS